MATSDFSKINDAIDVLINIKNVFRETAPTFLMDEIRIQKVKSNLLKLNRIIVKLNEKFSINPQVIQKKEENFKDRIKRSFFIVNSSKNRKKLIDLGVNSAQILATGGPITISDIQTLNPKITEQGLKSFKHKIQKFWKILNTKLQQGQFENVILLLEELNVADKILSKRKEVFEKRVLITVQLLTISSFDLLGPEFLSSLPK